MAENTADLIRQFKSKVEEAISLLPNIPDAQRDEVWTYWQIISVAVKVAVGGRGPIFAKQPQRGSARGRPRGRPPLSSTRQRDSVSPGDRHHHQAARDSVWRQVSKPSEVTGRDRQQQTSDGQELEQLSPGHQALEDEKDQSDCGSHFSTPSLMITVSSLSGDTEQNSSSFPLTTEPVVSNVEVCAQPRSPVSSIIMKPAPSDVMDNTQQTSRSSLRAVIPVTKEDAELNMCELSPVPMPTVMSDLSDSVVTISREIKLSSHSQDSANEDKAFADEKGGSSPQKDCTHELVSNHIDTSPGKASQPLELSDGTQTHSLSDGDVSHSLGNLVSGNQILNQTEEMSVCEMHVELTKVPSISACKTDEACHVLVIAGDGRSPASGISDTQISQSLGVGPASSLGEKKIPSSPTGVQTQVTEETERTTAGSSSISTSTTANLVPDSVSHSSLPLTSTAIIKRKRGRPPKNRTKASHVLISSASNIVEIAETNPKTSSERVYVLNKTEAGRSTDSFTISDSSQYDIQFKSMIAALELGERKETINAMSSDSPSSSSTVRRSERRSVPNRDKIFCYFSPTHQGKAGEEVVGVEDQKEVEEVELKEVEEVCDDVTEMVVSAVEQEGETQSAVGSEMEKVQERTCPICQAVLMSASSMAAHKRIHTGERPFACPVCHKTFTTKGNCERHEVTHVGLKAFTCTQCSKKFTEKKSLKIHMRGHTGDRPYQCKVCEMRFFQSGTLKTHMDRHTGHKGHLCELCGKAFRQSCQLRVHMRRHTKSMPFSCEYCDKTFYTKSDMERHGLKHTGERPFSCDQCSQTFTRLQYLRDHQNGHLGRQPYRCVICGQAFQDFASCHRHVNRHKESDSAQPPQQIHVEFPPDTPTQQVMEQVRVIMDQQNLSDYHTLILPEASTTLDYSSPTNTSTATTNTVVTSQPSAHTILTQLGVEVGESSEIYHITLVDPSQVSTVAEYNATQSESPADFSAINLLANATTQLSAPP